MSAPTTATATVTKMMERRPMLPPSPESALRLRFDPPSGFLSLFDDYMDGATDAPAVFRPFTALSVLSAVVGRNVTAPFGVTELVPNTFTVVLAASSFFHKTTQITVAKRLINAVNPEILLPDDFTPEKLLQLLQKNPQAFLAWPEFAGFLARSGRDYNAGSRELFMELYDCPESFRREIRSESLTITHPTVTILAASATSWLADQLRSGDLRSGFLNRFALVLAETKEKTYPIPEPADSHTWMLLTDKLRQVATTKGRADLSAIKGPYAAWYRHLEADAQATSQPEIVSAFYTRLSVTVLKYAVLIELASSGNLRVTPASLELSIALVDYLRAVLRHLLRTEFAIGDSARELQRLLTLVQKKPGCRKKDLLQSTGMVTAKLTPLISTLADRGDIYQEDGQWFPAG